jgi:hypothetical protein
MTLRPFCTRLAVPFVILLIAAGCGDDGSSAATLAPSSSSNAKPTCPAAWKADWQAWADRVGETVFCPSFIPSPITGEIGGQWNTAREPGKAWQLGYAWLEHDDLVHIVFEGYPEKVWPPGCEGVPCFDGKTGTETIAGHHMTWFDRNEASHSGHIAAVFHDGGNVYVVSMHVSRPYGTAERTTGLIRQMVAGLVPLSPQG